MNELSERLPAEAWQGIMLPFLSVNDVTNFSMSCRRMHEIVHQTRQLQRERHCLIWEARAPTKIGFEAQDEDHVTVWQVQPFQFILRNYHRQQQQQQQQQQQGETIQVKFTLQNECWDEHDNRRDGRRCRDTASFPSVTLPTISIIRPEKHNQNRFRLLELRPDLWAHTCDWDVCLGEKGGDNYEHLNNHKNHVWTPQDKDDLRTAMSYVYKCAQRIANFADDNDDGNHDYPSADYLMSSLPTWLRQYFPQEAAKSVNWNASDRETRVEFSYQPAQTLAEWSDLCVPRLCDGIHVHELQDIPWYRPGY